MNSLFPKLDMFIFKKIFTFLFVIFSSQLIGQNISYKIVENNVEERSQLHIRPAISFSIPPSDIIEGLPTTLSVEGQYWTDVADFRATAHVGTFKGISVGATYHLSDKTKVKKEKFVVSTSKTKRVETTTYFKAPVNMHKISGPCADLTTGFYGEAGFFTKLDLGWDFQHFGRSYAEYGNRTIKGSSNGWFSAKIQAVVANVAIDMTNYFNLGAGTGKYTEERKMAFGGQINVSGAVRPWRGVTFYMSLPLGYMRYIGVSDAPETTNRGVPILNIVLGAQINLLKKVQSAKE
jgi:hypothetical protein